MSPAAFDRVATKDSYSQTTRNKSLGKVKNGHDKEESKVEKATEPMAESDLTHLQGLEVIRQNISSIPLLTTAKIAKEMD